MCYNNELYHHGVKGQKWGVRRYQNKDGTLTSAGKKHLNRVEEKKHLSDKQKKSIKIGATIVCASVIAGVSIKHLENTGKLDKILSRGKDALSLISEESLVENVNDNKNLFPNKDPFKHAHFKVSKMPKEELIRAKELDKKFPEDTDLPISKSKLLSVLTSDLSAEEKEHALVYHDYGDYHYTAINKGHEDYKPIMHSLIKGTHPASYSDFLDDVVDDVLIEMFGDDYRRYL